MLSRNECADFRANDRGSTLVIVAGAMIALLAMSALAIDMVTFYAVRAEAQRAADAAALAGA
jgi:Flp pilus assembly protein TadG